jgi:hypothetical protein
LLEGDCNLTIEKIKTIDPLLFTPNFDLLRVIPVENVKPEVFEIHAGNGEEVVAVCPGEDNSLSGCGSNLVNFRCVDGTFLHIDDNEAVGENCIIENAKCTKV